jgi:hypothetical protein
MRIGWRFEYPKWNTKFRYVTTSEMVESRRNYGVIRVCERFSGSDEFAQHLSMRSIGAETVQAYKTP